MHRIAFIEAFRRRGIYPRDIRTLSEDSLCWNHVKTQGGIFEEISKFLREFIYKLEYCDNRRKIFDDTREAKIKLHSLLVEHIKSKDSQEMLREFENLTGLSMSTELDNKVDGLRRDSKTKLPVFQVHTLRGARRIGPDGDDVNQVIISIVQTRDIPFDEKIRMDNVENRDRKNIQCFKYRGGCTLILNLKDLSLRYAIKKRIDNRDKRLTRQRDYRTGDGVTSLQATYFGTMESDKNAEPFAFLHDHF